MAAPASAMPPPPAAAAPTTTPPLHRYGALFMAQSAEYAQFRPTYPATMYDIMTAYAGAHGTGSTAVAVDMACGSGQATVGLATRYDRVMGVDASPAQVAAAPPMPNATLHLGTAEATGLPPACADAMMVAQALHWFHLPAFYAEAARVLKPRGTIAIVTYGGGQLAGSSHGAGADATADAALQHTMNVVLGPYWDERRKLVDELYPPHMEPPVTDGAWTAVERHRFTMAKDATVAEVVGYVTTWSAYATFVKVTGTVRGSEADPAVQLVDAILRAYGGGDDPTAVRTRIEWPATLILGTRV